MPVKDELELTDEITDDKVKEGLLDVGNFDYQQRRDFQYANLGVKLGEYDLKRYRLAKLPTLSINGYYNKNAQRSTFDFLSGHGDWFGISAFTLQLQIPLFTGFSANARIAQANLALQKSINQREALKINIDSEIETAKIPSLVQ